MDDIEKILAAYALFVAIAFVVSIRKKK